VLGAILVVASLALADSLNPVTIAVAVYLASTTDPRPRLAAFAVGVFAVYLAGGALIVLGPGEALRSAVKGTDTRDWHVATIAIGALVIALAGVIWGKRRRFADRPMPGNALRPGAALALGAVVTAIDLPTALPYFAAIAAIVSSDSGLAAQLSLLVLFNLLYVLPLLGVLALHFLAGERSERFLGRCREWIQRFAPALLTVLTLAAGVALMLRGVSGLLR
jgi:cytochrome c biogenesis protein CcdA